MTSAAAASRTWGLGREGNPEPRRAEHVEIVGAITYREGLCGKQSELLREGNEPLPLCFTPENGLAHEPRQLPARHLDHVCAMLVESQSLGDVGCEHGEAARHEGAVSAVRLHGCNKRHRAGHEGNAALDFFKHAFGQPTQQPHPRLDGRLEIEFAAHGPRRHFFDLRSPADVVAEFVEHLLLDDGRFHIRHQQLAAREGDVVEYDVDVDR